MWPFASSQAWWQTLGVKWREIPEACHIDWQDRDGPAMLERDYRWAHEWGKSLKQFGQKHMKIIQYIQVQMLAFLVRLLIGIKLKVQHVALLFFSFLKIAKEKSESF